MTSLSINPSLPISLPPPPPPTSSHSHPFSYPNSLFLDSIALVRALRSCAAQNELRLVTPLHAAALKTGIHANLFVANSLLDAYSKCGHLDYAINLFDRMPKRDVVSWTTLISGYSRNGAAGAAVSVFLEMIVEDAAPFPNEFTLAALLQTCGQQRDEKLGQMAHGYLITSGFSEDLFLCNSLIDMYSKLGLISDAEKLVDRLSCRDVVSRTAMISGCVLHGMFEKGLVLFMRMLEDGILPNLVTMLSVIQACSWMCESSLFGQAHALVVKMDIDSDISVVNSLVEMYFKNGFVDEGLKVLFQFSSSNGYCCSDPEVMASLVHGCTLSKSLECGRAIHAYLIKRGFFPCSILENSLMAMYAEHQQVDSVHQIFARMGGHDIVAWNTLTSCFVKNGYASEALRYLTYIHGVNEVELVPDFIMMLNSIQACSEIASLQQGQILHAYVIRSGLNHDVFISNALIDMYSRSGSIDLAKQIFSEMDVKDLGSWNSMIMAFGIHGDSPSALKLFKELKRLGKHQPNAITFSSVLSACGHSGLVEEGYECFRSMLADYGIEPSMEHYASLVDLLGRSGKLNEAEDLIKEMPFIPGSSIWGSLLGACGLHGNVDIAERAAAKLSVLEPDGSIWRVALSNVYVSAGRWEDAAMVRAEMKKEGLRKEAGWSTLDVTGGKGFRFLVGDSRHPEKQRIYEVCNSIVKHIRFFC